jgi:hypothetical protein
MTNLTRLPVPDSPAADPAPTGSATVATEITVRCPSEPPSVPPDAARALLRILRAMAESDHTHRAPEREQAA